MKSQVIKTVPNLFTVGNLLCGVFSITFMMNDFIQLSALFIFLSAFLDLFDGRIARHLKANNELGVVLDSLADMVSFGVAPALLYHTLAIPSLKTSIAFILFPTMGALRLARFSVHPTIGYFSGIPITAAGLVLAGLGFFRYSNPFLTIILACLMVTPIKVKKL